MPEGYRFGEICEFLARAPSELGLLFGHDLAYLNIHLEEKARLINKAMKG
jgi:hypothetical protein